MLSGDESTCALFQKREHQRVQLDRAVPDVLDRQKRVQQVQC